VATSTFDKRIVIGDEAADVLIGLLNKPAPPRTDLTGKFKKMTEEDWECFMRHHSAKLSEHEKNKQ